MPWDAEQWSRRFELGANNADSYVRENRSRIARNDPRTEAAKCAVDDYSAKVDLYESLLGWTDSRYSLRHQVEGLRKSAVPKRSNIYERARYEAAWRRECEAIATELAASNEEA